MSSLALGTWLVVATAALSPAFATISYDQDGRTTGSTSIDGSFARLQGTGFHPNNQQCVLYATLSNDQDLTSIRQVESGLLRCVNATLDGTCTSGKVFVERYNGSAYFCTPGYSFDNIYQYDATTYRISSTSTTFTGQINGATLSQSGFGVSDPIVGATWGEATSGTTTSCPSGLSGSFFLWEKYDTSTGWSYVTGSNVYRNAFNMSGSPCWDTITSTNSQGAYDVHD
jgi:hypothetical protein